MRTAKVIVIFSALFIVSVSACTGSDQGKYPDSPPPYSEELFDDTALCDALMKAVPDGYMLNESAPDHDGGLSRNCSILQSRGQEKRYLQVDVSAYDFTGWQDDVAEVFDEKTQGSTISVEWLGNEAVFVVTTGPTKNAVVNLYVKEGNLVMGFSGYSFTDLNGPRYFTAPLSVTAQAVMESAEFYLTEIGAENADAPDAMTSVSGPFNELPDLCSELVFDGLSLAADQAEWADDSDVMDRCHWSDGEADLWLSAEAVGPPPVADVSAEEFATWWAGGLPVSDGEELGLGDQSAIAEVSLDDGEAAATDFVVRIGNVVLQGRYSDGTGESRSAAEGFAAVMTEQVQALLAGS